VAAFRDRNMRHPAGTAGCGYSRLSRGHILAIYMIGTGVWLSGVLWLWFHYFVVYAGRFGPTRSPAESWLMMIHGAFAFAAIWIFGLLWAVRIPAGWSGQRRRLSGGFVVALLAWLIIGGHLLYYLGDDRIRAVVSVSHWIVGLIAPIGFLAHRQRWGRKANDALWVLNRAFRLTSPSGSTIPLREPDPFTELNQGRKSGRF
jgi:hypothetical protein